MPDPNAFVAPVESLSQRPEEPRAAGAAQPPSHIVVNFQGGRTARLDMTRPQSQVWAEVLNALAEAGDSAYVVVEPSSGVVTDLLLPLHVTVGAITPGDASSDVEVELIISHARHYLRRTHPDFDRNLETLRTAQQSGAAVLITETPDTHEIIDVRLSANPSPMAASATAAAVPSPAVVGVSPKRAQQLFELVDRQTCVPATSKAPCIPFLYPDDGCWARAHEMCRIMIGAGEPQAHLLKVWIYGSAWPLASLRVATANNPTCEVRWTYHVAPALYVSEGTTADTYVIDPSMFREPVTLEVWSEALGDQSALRVWSDATLYSRTRDGTGEVYDPDYVYTRQSLTYYRNQLRLRAVSSDGPPPYRCPRR
jgi:hypothetical protein